MKKLLRYTSLICLVLVPGWALASTPGNIQSHIKIEKSFSDLPLRFEINEGQYSKDVKFLSRGQGYSMYFTSNEAVAVLSRATNTSSLNEDHLVLNTSVVRMEVLGANKKRAIKGKEKLITTSNYYKGNDRTKWKTGVSNFEKLLYKEVYQGIDLVFYGNQKKLEYDFIVKPGVNPNKIELKFKGMEKLMVDAKGNLILKTKIGNLVQHAPVIYQTINGKKTQVDGGYELKNDNLVSFHIIGYNPNYNLIIDPVLGFSTYLGGSNFDGTTGIALDSSGDVYVAGWTNSIDFDTLNPIEGDSPSMDAFVYKLDTTGNIPSLAWSTYLGGSRDDTATDITVNDSGDVYVTGNTSSLDFNTVNPIEGPSLHNQDVFVLKLNQSGNIPSLAWSTYMGGTFSDWATGIAVDDSNNTYVTGWTFSTDFDTKNAIEGDSGGADTFVFKISETGNVPSLAYSTYLGGADRDTAEGIVVHGSGTVFVTGWTQSTDFDTLNPIEGAGSNTGFLSADIFVFKLTESQNTPTLSWSTYLGGNDDDKASAIGLSQAGELYVTGATWSTDFDTLNPIEEYNGGQDIFVLKLNAGLNQPSLAWSTYLGGSGDDITRDIAVSFIGNTLFVTGRTSSNDFDTLNPIEGASLGSDVFVAKLFDTGTSPSLEWSTYLGGRNNDDGLGIAVTPLGRYAFVAGSTFSTDFDTVNSIEGANNGGSLLSNTFVFKIGESPSQMPNDFDGDSDSDVFLVHDSGILVSALIHNSVLQDFGFLLQADPGQGWTVNATGDFNRDKKADILLYNTITGEYRTVLLDGTTILSDTVVFTIDPAIGVEPFGIGDFSGDGQAEIIIYHPPSGFTALVYLTSSGNFSSFEHATTIDVTNNWTLQDVGHFNGDNKTDFLITNTVSGESAVIEMNRSIPTGPNPIFTFDPSTGWVVKDVGDFNGDDKTDVLIQHDTGALGVVLMDNMIFQNFYIPGGLLPQWELINVGNYDGVNKADFLIFDTATGDLMTAIQDGINITTYTPVINLGPVSGWSYHKGKP